MNLFGKKKASLLLITLCNWHTTDKQNVLKFLKYTIELLNILIKTKVMKRSFIIKYPSIISPLFFEAFLLLLHSLS